MNEFPDTFQERPTNWKCFSFLYENEEITCKYLPKKSPLNNIIYNEKLYKTDYKMMKPLYDNRFNYNNEKTLAYQVSNICETSLLLKMLVSSQYYFNVDNLEAELQMFNINSFRKVKGDGNCFYRAVMINYIEKCDIKALIANVYEVLNYENISLFYGINGKLGKNINKILLINVLMNISIDKTQDSINLLINAINNDSDLDFTLIFYFKLKIYNYLKRFNSYLLSPEFEVLIGNLLPEKYEDHAGNPNFEKYFKEILLKMNVDAEKVVIYITPYVLDVKLTVFMVEPSIINKSEFVSEESNIEIILLYIRSHYEIGYESGINKVLENLNEKLSFLDFDSILNN